MDRERYLRRIGFDAPLRVDHATLAALQRAHLLAVPFDALDCHLGLPVSVEPADAYRKVVERGRGGFCFELNGLFGWLLTELGFGVTLLSAQPFTGDGTLAPQFSHLALEVDLERPWLVDVGFGYFAREPLALDDPGEQLQDGRRFVVGPEAAGDDGLVAEELGMSRRWGYRFTLEPRGRADFADQCRIYATEPTSGFVQQAPVGRAFPDGWVTVTRERIIGSRGGVNLERPIAGEYDWRDALAEHFGFVVGDREVTASDV
jgi:N-hydroxyarylamine O-acetyltransferase